MTEVDVFADPEALRAVAARDLTRGTLRLVTAEGAAFVTEIASSDGPALDLSIAEPPTWLSTMTDLEYRSLPWVKVADRILDAMVSHRLTATDLTNAFVDGAAWPSGHKSILIVIENTAVAALVELMSSGRVQYSLVGRWGKAMPFGSNPGFEAIEDLAVVVGVGAIGSHLSAMLPNWGFRRLVFLDRERLTRENITVHLCGPEFVGRSKAKAVADTVQDRYEDVKAIALKLDVVDAIDELRYVMEDIALMVVAVDDPVVRQLCNHLALSLRIPTVFVALFRRGLIAEIVTFRPGSACLNCVRLAVQMDAAASDGRGSPSSYRGGLRTDIQLTAAQAARMSAALVHGKTDDLPNLPASVMYSSVVAISDLDPPWRFNVPGQVNWVPLQADPSCRVCQINHINDLNDSLARAGELLGSSDE